MRRSWQCSECGSHRPVFWTKRDRRPRRDKDHPCCIRCWCSINMSVKVQILDWQNSDSYSANIVIESPHAVTQPTREVQLHFTATG